MIYRTRGCINPAPYGAFDDEYHLKITNGNEFHLWSEEMDYLLGVIHNFQWKKKLIAFPELAIVTEWNTCAGVFGATFDATTELSDLSHMVTALHVIQANYTVYETAARGFGALLPNDLSALIDFFETAISCGGSVILTED